VSNTYTFSFPCLFSDLLATAPSSSNPKSVVHVISIAAQMEALAFPLYLSTKAALASFVRCMADLEHLHGIRVTGVCPGIVSLFGFFMYQFISYKHVNA
jgi:NAD(P)-dependent dehydrogenase (short-subunit alcohol dehydrogenase family)